jgi:hypothetical protein
MSRAVHDYETLEREYISTDVSIRELAAKHGIRSFSTVNVQKQKRDWDRKREEYRALVAAQDIETLVMARMKTIAEIHDELLYAVRAAIRRFISDLSKDQTVSARDVMGLIDKFLLLTGQPTARTESKNLDVHDFGGLLRGAPDQLLGELAELARQNGAGAKSVGRGPLVVLEGTRIS